MNVFKDIKGIEDKAAKEIEAAEKERDRILVKAREDAQQLIRDGEEESEKLRQEAVKSAQKKAEQAADKIHAQSDKDVQALESSAAKKTDDAVDLVMQRFGALVNDKA